MNIEHLGEFVSVVDHGSMTQAARSLHCTQSALSKHIAALERELGTCLLERTPSGIRPTQTGRMLYGQAARIQRAVADIYRAVGKCGRAGVADRPVGEDSVAERCGRLGSRCDMNERETQALTLHLLDLPLDDIADRLGTTRDDAAELLGGAYRKTMARNKQRLYRLMDES